MPDKQRKAPPSLMMLLLFAMLALTMARMASIGSRGPDGLRRGREADDSGRRDGRDAGGWR